MLAFLNLLLEVILANSEREDMKGKRVKICVRPPGTIFDEATEVLQQLESGKQVHAQSEWLYFPDVREMGKVLTPRRLELLKAILGWYVAHIAACRD